MQYIHYIGSIGTALVLGFALSALPIEIIAFVIAGALAALLAGRMKAGSEAVYWLFGLGTIALITVSNFGADFERIIVMTPLVFVVGYFVSRLLLRVNGTYPRAKS